MDWYSNYIDLIAQAVSSLLIQDSCSYLCKAIHYRDKCVWMDLHNGVLRVSPGPFLGVTLQVEIVDPESIPKLEYEVFRILDIPFPGSHLV